MSARLRVPSECRELALLMARHHGPIHRVADLRAATIVSLLEKTDAFRRPGRFRQLLEACRCDYNGRAGWQDRDYLSPAIFLQALAAAQSVAAGAIARACADKSRIADYVHAARVEAVRAALQQAADQPES